MKTPIQVGISAQVEVEVECPEGWNPETDKPTYEMMCAAEALASTIADRPGLTNYEVNAI
jgi:hypothetical protein